MDDELMFEYLVQMGAMRPEELEMRRRQAQVDALRDKGMQSPEGQMVGKHYVAPSITQYGAQMMNAYGARKSQEGLDAQMRGFNDRQRQMLEEMRRRRMGASPAAPQPMMNDPYSNLPRYGSVT